VDLDVGADRVQRSSPIGLGLEATLGEGPDAPDAPDA